MKNAPDSRNSLARLGGFLYLLWILTGLFAMFYIPSRINTSTDAATASQNILSNELLFRISILNGLISSVIWVFMVLIFYRLFKPVAEGQAKLLVALVLVQIPIGLMMDAFSITSLMILKGEVLNSFDLSRRQELAMLFLRVNDYTVSTLILFWGLWLFPLGILTYKSGFIPRFLGIWLLLNGCTFVIMSFMALVLPEYKDLVYKFGFPAMLGEVAFMLWLLIRGSKGIKV